MNNGSQSRKTLLNRLSKARSQQEISEAGCAATRYLAEYPDDLDVVLATEKLHQRGVKLADPNDEASPREVATYMIVSLILISVPPHVLALMGSGLNVIGASFGIGALVFFPLALAIAAVWRRFGKNIVRTLMNRYRRRHTKNFFT